MPVYRWVARGLFQKQDASAAQLGDLDPGCGQEPARSRPNLLVEAHGRSSVTVLYITDSPSGKTGLSDSVLFDQILFDRSWGNWGVRPVKFLFPI